ncbi:hypothetical protein RMATCC62417_02600 [Rhizopus microsporus]|nr:hypothetical protein RMATCC62417_02600 [Rhizopus microsporus]
MPAVNNDTGVQTELPAHIPSTSCISASIKVSKKYQDKVDKTEAVKKEKEKNKTTGNEKKQVRCPSCGGADHSRFSSKLCPMNRSKTKLPKPKGTVEKTFVIKTSLANTCRYPKFITLIQEVADHITLLIYAESIFANYCFKNDEELPVVTQNLLYNIFSIFAGQEKLASDSIKKSFKTFL